jgi:glycosyltransferase involved in cell wall biosynthesis
VLLSIITPAFNEAAGLEAMRVRLTAVMTGLGVDWEWLVIDDHSSDRTFAVIDQMARDDSRIRGFRLSRNCGSHIAIACGLHHARGDAAALLASDLQDPPEVVGALLEQWRGGAQVVWASRRRHPGPHAHAGFAAVYYWIMRHVVGMTEMPRHGADVFLVDRAVIDAFRRFPERGVSLFALITWLGFSQGFVEYDKRARSTGRSGWTRAKKIKLVIDSVTGFTDAPIRACAGLGVVFLAVGIVLFAAGASRWIAAGAGHYSMLLAAVVGLTGVQLVALGVVGEYVWQALEESRRRPAYVIETATASAGPSTAQG